MDNSSKIINMIFITLSLVMFVTYGYDLIQTWILSGYEIPWRETFSFAMASMALFIFTKQYLDGRSSSRDGKKNADASNKDNKK